VHRQEVIDTTDELDTLREIIVVIILISDIYWRIEHIASIPLLYHTILNYPNCNNIFLQVQFKTIWNMLHIAAITLNWDERSRKLTIRENTLEPLPGFTIWTCRVISIINFVKLNYVLRIEADCDTISKWQIFKTRYNQKHTSNDRYRNSAKENLSETILFFCSISFRWNFSGDL